MPRVILRRTWFAPTDYVKVDRLRTMAGQRFRRGEHDIPQEYMDFLPSDAEVLDEHTKAAPATPVEETLSDNETENAHVESISDASEDIQAKRASFQAELEAEAKPKKRGRPRKGT